MLPHLGTLSVTFLVFKSLHLRSSASHLLSVLRLRHNLSFGARAFRPRLCTAMVSAPRNMELFTPANPKHTLLSDVILRRTTFTQLTLPPSGPHNAPLFSTDTLAYINLLLTYTTRLHSTTVNCALMR